MQIIGGDEAIDDLTNVTGYVEGDVMWYAEKYGEKLNATKGRLLTVTEVEELGGSRSSNSTSDCPAFINATNYWLGSASIRSNFVWFVYSDYSPLYGDDSCLIDYHYSDIDDFCGVRPVIEISKSKVSISD